MGVMAKLQCNPRHTLQKLTTHKAHDYIESKFGIILGGNRLLCILDYDSWLQSMCFFALVRSASHNAFDIWQDIQRCCICCCHGIRVPFTCAAAALIDASSVSFFFSCMALLRQSYRERHEHILVGCFNITCSKQLIRSIWLFVSYGNYHGRGFRWPIPVFLAVLDDHTFFH